jgi:D-aminopeptidase
VRSRGLLSARDLGLKLGSLPAGTRNAITDVEGVRVGHCTVTTVHDPAVQTGVTVVVPHDGNAFRDKLVAACHVVNGFAKPFGLVQIAELGQLESPIALTNTLSVPAVADGLVDGLLAANPEIGTRTGSVNAVVAECNDGYLNDLRGRYVRREHVAEALAAATDEVMQGAVGAGRGMSAYGLKGGVGTASRRVTLAGIEATVGTLALVNLGRLSELVIAGRSVGAVLARERRGDPDPLGAGSVVLVVATDAPLSDRQLGRALRRVQSGIARTGATVDSGSGELAIGFTTAFRIPHAPRTATLPFATLQEDGPALDVLFAAVVESTEEAILNALLNAETVVGRDGAQREGFPIERLDELMRLAEQKEGSVQ